MSKRASLLFAVTLAAVIGMGGALGAQDAVVDQSDQNANDTQAYLGLGVAPLHPALTNQLPGVIGEGRGVLVEQVMEGSPAEKAGLRKYDVLVRFNDQDLYAPEQLVKLVRNAQPGSEVSLTYVRGGQIHDAKVVLGKTPSQEPIWRRSFRFPFLERFLRRDQPRSDQQPGLAEQPRIQTEPTPWTTFESMTIAKQEDGTYRVQIDYRQGDKKHLHREYVGTREEIKKAIESDKDLPAAERQHLLRSLDKQDQGDFVFPWLEEWDRELFHWPYLDF